MKIKSLCPGFHGHDRVHHSRRDCARETFFWCPRARLINDLWHVNKLLGRREAPGWSRLVGCYWLLKVATRIAIGPQRTASAPCSEMDQWALSIGLTPVTIVVVAKQPSSVYEKIRWSCNRSVLPAHWHVIAFIFMWILWREQRRVNSSQCYNKRGNIHSVARTSVT